MELLDKSITVLQKLLTDENGNLDYKKYALLKEILKAHVINSRGIESDPVELFNLFFPADEVAKAVANVMERQYLTYDKLELWVKRTFPDKEFRIFTALPGVLYVPTNKGFFIFSYLMSANLIIQSISNRIKKVINEYKIYQISANTYKKAFTKGRLLNKDEFMRAYVEHKGQEDELEFLYREILKQAAYREASDVHFEVSGDLGVIRFRTAGALEPFLVLPRSALEPLITNYVPTRVGINTLQPDAPRIEDARDTIKLESGEDVNLRLAFAPVMTSQGRRYRLVVRLLRMNTSLMSGLDGLGLTQVELDLLKTALKASNGMILTSGPTSSGKSTTLYGLLLNVDWDRKVITIEDPVEFSNPYLWTQHQVEKRQGLDFKAYLRIVLREDPDVVLVGEVRDEETAKAMVEMANTGHLTFATIHANNCVDVVKRLTDLGLPINEIVEYGLVFMAQRLLRKSCPHCRYKGKVTKAEAEILGIPEGTEVTRNKGCEKCGGTGVIKDRILVLELLPVLRPEVKELLIQKKPHREVFKILEQEGYKSMVTKALELNKKELVSLEEILDKMRS